MLTQSNNLWRRSRAPAAVLALPAVVLALTPTMLLQATWLDPYVYTGYIYDYRQTYLRYGATYYSNRISAIDLSRLVQLFVHSDASYYVVRYLLLAMAASSIFAIARRFYGTGVGLFAAVLLCFSPWYLRAIAWNYVDGFAITYLFVAFAFLLVPSRRLIWGHVLAGAFFAFAVNTNLYALAFGGVFAPSWYVLQSRGRNVRQLCRLAVAAVCGFVVAYFVLGVLLHLEFPDRPLFFEGSTLVMASTQLGFDRSRFFHPLTEVLLAARRNYILVPVMLCLTVFVVLARAARGWMPKSRGFVVAASLYMVTTVAVYLFAHFGMHHGIIRYTYYFSYALIASSLVMVMLIGEAAAAVNQKTAAAALSAGAGIYVLQYVLYSPTFAAAQTWPLWVWGFTSLLLPACVLLDRQSLARLVIVLLCLIVVPVPFYHSIEDYRLLHSRTKQIEEWDVYRGARYFQSAIGNALRPTQVVKFWYQDDENDRNLNSIQSMYLWGFSGIGGMPHVDDRLLKESADARYLVLLGLTTRELDEGTSALSVAHIPFKLIRHDQFTGAVWSFHFATLELIGRHP